MTSNTFGLARACRLRLKSARCAKHIQIFSDLKDFIEEEDDYPQPAFSDSAVLRPRRWHSKGNEASKNGFARSSLGVVHARIWLRSHINFTELISK